MIGVILSLSNENPAKLINSSCPFLIAGNLGTNLEIGISANYNTDNAYSAIDNP